MCFYLRNWQVTFLLYTLGVFISEYTAKAFTEPRDYRVVFLIQKARPYKEQARQSNSMKFFQEADSENAQTLSKPKTPQSIRAGLRRIGD